MNNLSLEDKMTSHNLSRHLNIHPDAIDMIAMQKVPSNSVNNEEMLELDSCMQQWTGIDGPQQRKYPVELMNGGNNEDGNNGEDEDDDDSLSATQDGFVCSYCCLTFRDRAGLRAHCQSQEHQAVIMSDEGRDWKCRPPPRGLTSDAYGLCDAWTDNGACRYGSQCVDAHGGQELVEWKERFEYRRMKMQRAYAKELFGKAYTEQLLERWVAAPSADKVMREALDCVEVSCSAALVTTVADKRSTREWAFTLTTDRPLKFVALLQDATRNHFHIRHVSSEDVVRHAKEEWTPTNTQEWPVPTVPQFSDAECVCIEHVVLVDFATDIYGTFRQTVVFDLGGDPVLVRHLCVDVVPVERAEEIREAVKEVTAAAVERWDARNANITPYTPPSATPSLATAASAGDAERERDLLSAYPGPRADTFVITQSTVAERRLTKNNYRARMHELLAVEEMARYEQVSRYNMCTQLRLATSYLLAPSGIATSTAKYAQSGELFAVVTLGTDVSEDTSAGRLILNNCTTLLLAPSGEAGEGRRSVHEALIEDKGKNMIYLRISNVTTRALGMRADTDFSADIQFQLNRIPYCEWHYAIDKIADFRVIFPETFIEPSIPWTPQKQWSGTQDSRLNLKQKEAVVAITTQVGIPLPPILIIGPFGTGKTYTLAQAIKQLLRQSDTRVLVCTHSNSAADLYIKDYLHPWVEAGNEDARPLRIYYHKRWVATVNQTVQKYCLIALENGVRTFKVPTVEDIMRHRIVVVTLSISMCLATLGLQKGHFTHILLDEAAQAMECEAIMPLALASPETRVVLAGDHMQLSPEVFSQFAKERNLHLSLLERLYDHYPPTFPCKVLLCENYRAHEAIIKFTSELFYEQKLISSSKQPRHEKFYPLTFFTTRGEDVQDANSTAFYNNSEVYEVVERVSELRKQWPAAWGKLDEQSIGIMTPYADQVFRIRSELRKRRMGGISVERVLNVQGKQFRAIFLSTVRTRHTCSSSTKSAPGGDEMDYGFLSNSKLLNTAITRAQSLVAVVGDPIALCSIGRCRKVWERFIETCNENSSLFGITWTSLRSQLDNVELKKAFVLNPLAPEFVPRAYRHEPYIRLPQAPAATAPRLFFYPPPPVQPWPQQRPVKIDDYTARGQVDSYVPGGASLHQQQLQRGFQGPTRGPEDRVQFLHNVHFPEHDARLLPGGVTLHDMLTEPRARQQDWCAHLLRTQGPIAANKFMELLIISSRKPPEAPPRPIEMPSLQEPPPRLSEPPPHLPDDADRWSQSVPLYRRQPAETSQAFAGYARAAFGGNRDPCIIQAQPSMMNMFQTQPNMMPPQNIMQTRNSLVQMQMPSQNTILQSQIPSQNTILQSQMPSQNTILQSQMPPQNMIQSQNNILPSQSMLQSQNSMLSSQSMLQSQNSILPSQNMLQSQNSMLQSPPNLNNMIPTQNLAGLLHPQSRGMNMSPQPILHHMPGMHLQQPLGMFPPQFPPMFPPSRTEASFFAPQPPSQPAPLSQQQLMSQHVNADFGSEMDARREATYASVLRSTQPAPQKLERGAERSDPFAVLRALGNKRDEQGVYQYF